MLPINKTQPKSVFSSSFNRDLTPLGFPPRNTLLTVYKKIKAYQWFAYFFLCHEDKGSSLHPLWWSHSKWLCLLEVVDFAFVTTPHRRVYLHSNWLNSKQLVNQSSSCCVHWHSQNYMHLAGVHPSWHSDTKPTGSFHCPEECACYSWWKFPLLGAVEVETEVLINLF